ncbi:lamin tail domain-containing protein [Myxococcus sp. 1LA]
MDHAYGDGLGALGNSGGRLGVRCGARVLDEVQLSAPAKSGVARIHDGRLVPDVAGNDDLARWCDAPDAGGGGTFQGSPGAANAPCGTPGDAGVSVDAGHVPTCVSADSGVARPLARPRAGDLVITEVMANPRGDDTLGEWVELLATAPVDLNGVTLAAEAGESTVAAEGCLSLAAGEYALLARRADATLNGGLPEPRATFPMDLRNAGGRLLLKAGDVVVDAVDYGPAVDGVATQVSAPLADSERNDAPSAWCGATAAYGTRGNLGTPGRVNRACEGDGGSPGGVGDGGTPDGGADAGTPEPQGCIDRTTGRSRALRIPDAGSLVLTEFMADPQAVADATGEWVEVLALRDVDLNGVSLSNEGGSRSTFESALCLAVKAGSRAILARSEDVSRNGGLPAVLGTFHFNLANTAGNRKLELSVEGRVLDAVSWTGAAIPGVSSQLDPARSDPQRNDWPGSFCPTPESARYGRGDRGTPGGVNRPCAP